MLVRHHKNAKTTIKIRQEIKNSQEPIHVLARRYNITPNTVLKWKHRENLEDRSSCRHRLNTVLSELDQYIICEIRRTTRWSILDLADVLKPFIPQVNKNNIHRCLKRHGLSNLRKMELEEKDTEKEKPKRFPDYLPGYLHVDVKELPKLKKEAKKKYLFVAIDRATRFAYISLKDSQSAQSATEFLEELIREYPFQIDTILTDNGKEFTDRYCRGKSTVSGKHPFDRACAKYHIKHRLTRPYTPKTNGMVERFNGRIEEILKSHRFETYNQVMDTLNHYLKCYNYFNKQRTLNNRSPSEMIISWYSQHKELFKPDCNISAYNLKGTDN